jgi:hypothetical protein
MIMIVIYIYDAILSENESASKRPRSIKAELVQLFHEMRYKRMQEKSNKIQAKCEPGVCAVERFPTAQTPGCIYETI